MTKRVYCNVCLTEARMLADEKLGRWVCLCCGRHLWPLDATFALSK